MFFFLLFQLGLLRSCGVGWFFLLFLLFFCLVPSTPLIWRRNGCLVQGSLHGSHVSLADRIPKFAMQQTVGIRELECRPWLAGKPCRTLATGGLGRREMPGLVSAVTASVSAEARRLDGLFEVSVCVFDAGTGCPRDEMIRLSVSRGKQLSESHSQGLGCRQWLRQRFLRRATLGNVRILDSCAGAGSV